MALSRVLSSMRKVDISRPIARVRPAVASLQVYHNYISIFFYSLADTFAGTNPQDRIISITHEREVLGRTPMSPSFVPEAAINDTSIWLGTVGPALAQATFEVKTVNDSLWLVDFVTLEQRFPEAHRAVTKLNLPCFNWFSGISSNRTNNPFVFLATHLKHLKVLSFTLNTGGLTTSIYPGEKERMEIEAEDVEKSKELRVKSLDQIIMFYALHQLFSAPMLTKVNITSFDDNNVAYHCKHENPVNIVYQLADFLVDGFVQHQRRVVEVSVRITGATPAQ